MVVFLVHIVKACNKEYNTFPSSSSSHQSVVCVVVLCKEFTVAKLPPSVMHPYIVPSNKKTSLLLTTAIDFFNKTKPNEATPVLPTFEFAREPLKFLHLCCKGVQ